MALSREYNRIAESYETASRISKALKENGVVLWRVWTDDGKKDSPPPESFHSDRGVFFASNPEYFKYQTILGYQNLTSVPYLLKSGVKVFDQLDENSEIGSKAIINTWSDIRLPGPIMRKYDIEDECDFEMDGDFGVTSTDGLGIVGRKLGYDATVIKNIPSDHGWDGKVYTEWVVYDSKNVERI